MIESLVPITPEFVCDTALGVLSWAHWIQEALGALPAHVPAGFHYPKEVLHDKQRREMNDDPAKTLHFVHGCLCRTLLALVRVAQKISGERLIQEARDE
jgi:hypothetical protein